MLTQGDSQQRDQKKLITEFFVYFLILESMKTSIAQLLRMLWMSLLTQLPLSR